MAAAYIEPRPKAREAHAKIEHFTIVSGGADHGTYATQEEAIEAAKKGGYTPVHVARVRHNIDHGNPDHFRKVRG